MVSSVRWCFIVVTVLGADVASAFIVGAMSIPAWMLLGFLSGAIAKMVMPGEQRGGIILTMLLGIIGSMVGGYLGSMFFNVDLNQGFFDLSTWASAVGGALVVLTVYGFITGSRRR